MTEDQKVYKEIGRLLWSIMPEEAKEMILVIAIYSTHIGGGVYWIKHDGSEGQFGFDRPDEVEDRLRALCKRLQTLPPFAHEPFTHCEARLSEAGKFHMEFAYIPEEDTWPSLFMRGVSNLKDEERAKYGVPREDWEIRVAKFGPTKRA